MRLALHAAAAALLACGGQPPAATPSSAVDRQLAENAERHGIAGQAVLILRNGETVYRGSHGPADREARTPVRPGDIFPVFSVSKLFASLLVMQLVEAGKLDLSAPASRYLPDLPERWRSIAVDEFLNHVSGVPDYFHGPTTTLPPTRQAIFERLAGKPMDFATGTATRYNQTNFIVLGAIVETLHGMPYRQIVTERIVEPLGLTNTYLGKRHVPAGKVVKSYRGEVENGLGWLARSAQGDAFSRYHAEAGIAAEHCLAPSFAETRWDRIAECYAMLERLAPSALHTLNRAVAVAEWRGPADGLAVLAGLEPPSWLAGSFMWAAVLADLHRRCGHDEIAQRYTRAALDSAPSTAVRDRLRRRLQAHDRMS